MSTTHIQILIHHRLAQAEEALADAVLLFEQKRFRSAANRSYYAMFYAVLALSNLTEQSVSKHSGAIALFDREFVKTGTFGKELSKWLHEAFQERQRADYAELSVVTVDDAERALDHARLFVMQLRGFIEKQLDST